MRLGRIEVEGVVYLARIDDNGVATLVYKESSHPAADALREAVASGAALGDDEIGIVSSDYKVLSPVKNPSKFFGVGLNYYDHAREGGHEVPDRPTFFLKTPNTIIGPTDAIRYNPAVTTEVDFEAELAVVIGTTIRGGDIEDARAAILGYTVCNDVTARDAQFSDIQWPRSKCFDTFGPIGPWIVTADSIDPSSLSLWSEVNGDRMQDGTTAEMVFSPVEVVAFLARSTTLEPGDVIITGTPAGVGFARNPPLFLRDGDVVEVHIEGIGGCINPVSTLQTTRTGVS